MKHIALYLYIILSYCSVIIFGQGPVTNFQVQDCGVSWDCVGFPNADCVGRGLCTNLLKYSYAASDPNHVKVELHGIPPMAGANDFWIAVGFNHEPNSMAGTLVSECVYNAGQVDVFASYNGEGYVNQRLQQPKDGITGISGSLKNQILTCSFTLNRLRRANDMDFDLATPLYVVMGQGPAEAWELKPHHVSPYVTPDKLTIASNQPRKPFPNLQPLLTVSPVPAATPASNHDVMDASAPVARQITPGNSVEGCFETKGCLTYPPNCFSSKTCVAILSYTADPDNKGQVRMELWRQVTQPGDHYVAVGLAAVSPEMANSGVLACVSYGDNVDVIASYNPGRYNVEVNNQRENITVTKKGMDGKSLYCQFTMPSRRSFAGSFASSPVVIDVSNQSFLMLAHGPAYPTGKIRKHSIMPISTANAVRMDSVAAVRSSDLPLNLYKSHAGLMVGAWMFLASVGILTARYYKTMWTDYSPFGIKIWFHIHRPFMFLAVLASIAAFVIIYIRTGGLWTATPPSENAHPIIGFIAFVLGLMQPIVALFRPNPGAKNRPLFNWFHWGVGFACHILAIAAIYLGLMMPQMSIYTDYGYTPIWIMVAFSAFHALWLILLQIIEWIIPSLKKRQQTMQMKTINGNGQVYQETTISRSKPGSVLKTLMWIFHFVVVAGFTIAILVLIGISH
ncbi:ferric-chelate reductase 1-like [Paramacrobiotus metropolitanus]|uniref:ferric-chelate reductase 1-like n=1 Tax=Paramacrobiotus metropolitanus TaxID=2943436 RepID=UPI002446335C|nr:ferric-chelate reductase 1-like [Paramacrobiotus metropolitanus]